MPEPVDKPSRRMHSLAMGVAALAIAATFAICAMVTAAMLGVTWLSHEYLTPLPTWMKVGILLAGLGITLWTTWSLDPAFNRSWRVLLLRQAAWPIYALFGGSVSVTFRDAHRLNMAAPYITYLLLSSFDLWFRFEPRVLRFRDRIRGEVCDK